MAGPYYPEIEKQKRLMGDEPLLTAWEISSSWRSIWLKAIARSWRDDKYRGRLLDRKTTAAALKEVGFDVPTFFGKLLEVEVTEPSPNAGIEYVSTTVVKKRFKNGWIDPKHRLRAKLTLVLPPPPENTEDYGIAIADYESGGRVYPFTLC